MNSRASLAWLIAVLIVTVFASASPVFAQTNADPDLPPGTSLYNLTGFSKTLRTALWSFGSLLLLGGVVVAVLKYRVRPSSYGAAVDEHWEEDAIEELEGVVDDSEIADACQGLEETPESAKEVKAAVADPVPEVHHRMYTPAEGPVWTEPMLNAFLLTCLKANCLGRRWQEEAARRQAGRPGSPRVPDPREAELIRKFKARWQEFHVDPETGIFVDHVSSSGTIRVCVVQVWREKRTVARAALNAGFVIDSVGRYFKSSDLAYPTGDGCYHAPTGQELGSLSETEKRGVIRVKDIPNAWETMIAGELRRRGATGPGRSPRTEGS